MMKKICVYCSSRADINPLYIKAAEDLAKEIGRRGDNLVYGGVSKGLMEIIAKGVKTEGGSVTGVIPKYMIDRGFLSEYVDDIIVTQGLCERKQEMLKIADVFVALPGGIGTLDEVVGTISGTKIGEHTKTTILFNVNGFWNSFMNVIEMMNKEGVNEGFNSQYLKMVNTIDEVIELL